jgi:hypothetical protein
MVTITLTPELEKAVSERARLQGTTPQILIENDLREKYLPGLPATPPALTNAQSMADFFAGYIGSIDSSNVSPGGSDLSANTGQKFKELMLKKYREGKL